MANNEISNYSILYNSDKSERTLDLYPSTNINININNSKEESKTFKLYIFICYCCRSTPKIKIIDRQTINIKCHNEYKIISIDEDISANYFYENDIKMNAGEKIEDLYCKRHSQYKVFSKYERYCLHCKRNLCRDCNHITSCENHNFKSLKLDNNIQKYLQDYIEKYSLVEKGTEFYFCNLIEVLLFTNEQYPNINTLTSLENIYKFLKGENHLIKIKKGRIIYNMDNLSIRKSCQQSYQSIYKIFFNNNNFRNIRYLTKILKKTNNNISLIKLFLGGNNLTSIKYLAKASIKNNFLVDLKHLDIGRNNLGDNNIKYICELNCNKLEKLYLYSNNFTDYSIFNKISEKFKNLKGFYLGFNRFNQDTINKLTKCEFPKLEAIGLNYAFNEDNYEKLSLLNMKNIKYLYIQYNGIGSLKFLFNMGLINLVELHLNSNNLNEIDLEEIFNNFKMIKGLYIENNILTNIINLDALKNKDNFSELFIQNNKLDSEMKNKIKQLINEVKNIKIKY